MGIINEIICTKMKPFIHSHRVLPIARSRRAPPPSSSSGVIEPFGEAIMCNKGFKSLGGHAIFDNKIVIN